MVLSLWVFEVVGRRELCGISSRALIVSGVWDAVVVRLNDLDIRVVSQLYSMSLD